MAGGADDEHVTETLIEDDLGGDAAVGAPEDHGCRPLSDSKTRSMLDALAGVLRGSGDEPLVTLLECLPCMGRSGVRHGPYCALRQ